MEEKIIVYGTNWCGDCHRSRRLLDRLDVKYQWVDVDRDVEASNFIKNLNNGMRVVPTIVFSDGAVLFEPSDPELAEKLGVN